MKDNIYKYYAKRAWHRFKKVAATSTVAMMALTNTVQMPVHANTHLQFESKFDGLEQTEKMARVNYLMVDKDQVASNATIDSVMYGDHHEFITQLQVDTPMYKTKDGDYTFSADIMHANGLAKGDVMDVVFSNANLNGEDFKKGTSFDKETMTATVSKSATKQGEDDYANTQLQIMIPVDRQDTTTTQSVIVENNKLSVEPMMDTSVVSTISTSAYDHPSFALTTPETAKNVEKSQLKVEVNDGFELSQKQYGFDQKTGVFEIYAMGGIVKNIRVSIESDGLGAVSKGIQRLFQPKKLRGKTTGGDIPANAIGYLDININEFKVGDEWNGVSYAGMYTPETVAKGMRSIIPQDTTGTTINSSYLGKLQGNYATAPIPGIGSLGVNTGAFGKDFKILDASGKWVGTADTSDNNARIYNAVMQGYCVHNAASIGTNFWGVDYSGHTYVHVNMSVLAIDRNTNRVTFAMESVEDYDGAGQSVGCVFSLICLQKEPDTAKLSEQASGKETSTVKFNINKVDKDDANKKLEGVAFDFYRDNQKIGSAKTDKNGVATFTNTLTSDTFNATSGLYTYVSDWNGMNSQQQQEWLSEHSNVYATQAQASAAARQEAQNKVNQQKQAFKNTNHTYKVVETATKKGYFLDPAKTTQTQSKAGDVTVSMDFVNEVVKGSLELNKVDAESNQFVPVNQADLDTSLDGAVYELRAREDIKHPADQSVVYKKDEKVSEVTIVNGKAKVDELFLGKYYWKEIQAPKGYHSGTFVDGKLVSEVDVTLDTNETNKVRISNASTSKDKATDIRLQKVDANTGEPVKGATLVLLDKETNKKVKFNTAEQEMDEKKQWVSNGNELVIRGLTVGHTYIVQEIHAPNGYALGSDIEFTVDDEQEVQIVSFKNKPDNPHVLYELGTTASVNGKKTVNPKENVTIDDVVSVEVIADDESVIRDTYTIRGILMDKETGEALVDANGNTFTKEISVSLKNGKQKHTVSFDVPGVVVAGKDIVVYEYLFDDQGTKVATHEDINDEDQTVTFTKNPVIKTTALANGQKTISASMGDVNVVDVVEYGGLVKGQTYTLKGVLMDKSTKKEVVIDDQTMTSETTFIANESGKATVPFTFNVSKLAGKDIVVYETLYDEEGNEVVKHEDINDKDQTIHVTELKIGTKATVNGQKEVMATGEVELVDTVSYYGLTPNKRYTLSGELMDKETGKTTGLKVESSFTPESADGETTVTFTVDASKFKGKQLVVFEELYSPSGDKVAEHKDLEDKDQTVTFVDLTMKTVATIDGQKEVEAGGNKTINDTVKYTGLKAGQTYKLKGVLMDKETGKVLDVKNATSECTFKADEKGEVVVSFKDIDTSKLANKHIVVFEELFDEKGNKLVEHKDLEDKDQTVFIKEAPKSTTPSGNQASNTGNTTPMLVVGGLSLLGVAIALLRKKFVKE